MRPRPKKYCVGLKEHGHIFMVLVLLTQTQHSSGLSLDSNELFLPTTLPLRDSSSQNENLVIYSPLSCSKPVGVSFFCWTLKKIFRKMLVIKQLMVAKWIGTSGGWVNDNRIFIFGWTISLSYNKIGLFGSGESHTCSASAPQVCGPECDASAAAGCDTHTECRRGKLFHACEHQRRVLRRKWDHVPWHTGQWHGAVQHQCLLWGSSRLHR